MVCMVTIDTLDRTGLRRDRDGDLVPDLDPIPAPRRLTRCAHGRPIARDRRSCCVRHDHLEHLGEIRFTIGNSPA
jgi:hypothetical protein